MSIGLSVDYSAYICFGYMIAQGEPYEKALQALRSLGWPVVQGALAALLGVSALGLIQTYIVQTFFKTVFLVIIFGIIHSCFFLPVLLTLTDDVIFALRKRARVGNGKANRENIKMGHQNGSMTVDLPPKT